MGKCLGGGVSGQPVAHGSGGLKQGSDLACVPLGKLFFTPETKLASQQSSGRAAFKSAIKTVVPSYCLYSNQNIPQTM